MVETQISLDSIKQACNAINAHVDTTLSWTQYKDIEQSRVVGRPLATPHAFLASNGDQSHDFGDPMTPCFTNYEALADHCHQMLDQDLGKTKENDNEPDEPHEMNPG